MHPAPSARRHRDGTSRIPHPLSTLRIAPSSPSRLLRAGQSRRCRNCGHRVDVFERDDRCPVALHPAELLTAHVPDTCRWHVSSGIAHPHPDHTAYCRITHALLCPSRTPASPLPPHLGQLRLELAVRTRRMIDTQTHTPAATPHAHAAHTDRPVMRILLVDHRASGPLETQACLARTPA
ncbi:DUF6083 domain-containing protein [Streptomyces sp. NPDC093252]|uniref:DUF6083 domain-containing protein n=1 Tax=Streptomyces sp. NPDC093252 TaxID=3154980 RepID=UPI00343177B8